MAGLPSPRSDDPSAPACATASASSLPGEGPLPSNRRVAIIAGLVVLLTAVAALFYYKWSGSYRTVDAVRASGWTRRADAITSGGVVHATIEYFGRVWIALVFGIVIGAAVRSLISPRWVTAVLARGGTARRQMSGALAGAPLMLCSCCVTPIFTGVYERGAPLGSALSLMLASPALNLAALVLTFMLFPLNMALARLCAALLAVFVLPALLERLFGGQLEPVAAAAPDGDEGPRGAVDFAKRFARNLGYLTLVTVPLIAAGVLLSSVILPYGLSHASGGALASVVVIAAIAVLVALPTFFEIPLAILLLQMGAPGAATAMLFAGPIVNLPSLFVLGRATSAKVSASLAAGIWLLGIAAGAAVLV